MVHARCELYQKRVQIAVWEQTWSLKRFRTETIKKYGTKVHVQIKENVKSGVESSEFW